MASLLDAVAWRVLQLANSIPKCRLGAGLVQCCLKQPLIHNVDADRSHGKRPGSPPERLWILM